MGSRLCRFRVLFCADVTFLALGFSGGVTYANRSHSHAAPSCDSQTWRSGDILLSLNRGPCSSVVCVRAPSCCEIDCSVSSAAAGSAQPSEQRPVPVRGGTAHSSCGVYLTDLYRSAMIFVFHSYRHCAGRPTLQLLNLYMYIYTNIADVRGA